MTLKTRKRTVRFAALTAAILLPLSAAACGMESNNAAPAGGTSSAPMSSPSMSAPASPSASESMSGSMTEPFGAACSSVPKTGKGSFDGMSQDPVATAASNNPALSTLVTAVKAAGLVDTLNTTDDITVFAPTNDAFKDVEPATLKKAMGDPKGLLTDVLTAHVVPNRLSPDQLAGEHQTLNKSQPVTVTGPAGSDGVGGPAGAGVGGRQRHAARLADLLDRSARGQEEAFAELYDRTASRIYGVVLKVLRSPDQAAEVAQEVYAEIWRQSSRFSAERGSVLAWMVTIAHRRAVDRVRSTVSETRRDAAWGRLDAETPHDQVWDALEHRLDTERVRRGLESLTLVQREAVTLAYFGGYTHREVAALLKLPLGTVKPRIRDGLIGLRDALGVEA